MNSERRHQQLKNRGFEFTLHMLKLRIKLLFPGPEISQLPVTLNIHFNSSLHFNLCDNGFIKQEGCWKWLMALPRSEEWKLMLFWVTNILKTEFKTENSKFKSIQDQNWWHFLRQIFPGFLDLNRFTLAALFSWYIDGSSAALPDAHLVAPMSSARAFATSLTAFIRTTYTKDTERQ